MQHIKGAIRWFAILMAVCCVFYLSFTWATNRTEKKAHAFAQSFASSQQITDMVNQRAGTNNFKKSEIIDSVVAARERYYLDSIGTLKNHYLWYTYSECKEKELNLGLDLKGGMNVTLEVGVYDIVKSLSGNSTAPDFQQAMTAAASDLKAGKGNDFVTLFGDNYKKVNPNGRLSSLFAATLKERGITFSSTDDQVLKAIREESASAVDRAKLVLETRINKFGVAQPNIQKLEGTGRILVELPGVKDKDRVRKLLQGSANLEFWETYNFMEIQNQIGAANEKLKIVLGLKDSTAADTNFIKPDYTAAKSKIDSAKVDSLVKKTNDSIRLADSVKAAQDTTKKNERQPLPELMAFNQNPEANKALIAYAAVKDTAKINGYLRMPGIAELFPRDLKFAWTIEDKKNPNVIQLVALKESKRGGPAMQGDVITNSRKQFDQMQGGSPEISMTMNSSGSKDWARITRENTGRCIAIVLDGNVYSYPNVNGEITGGQSSITGSFTIQEADDLVNVLNTGKLPAPARIVEEVVVGATLGADAVKAGVLSFLVALIVVLIYMAFYYNKGGLVADVALFVNVFFVMGILTSLGAVLTLPGIAGIVLTIALSVDANILIFERIREELREGKGIALAIADGYKHAMSSILDSNLTTLILGIILYAFGTGPVQGFATTLIIGILSSMFCAIFITRLIFDWMLKREMDIKFSTGATENVLRNTKFDFVSRRKMFYAFSAAIIVLGVVFFFKNNGFKKGVDFSGGRSFTVRFENKIDAEVARKALATSFGVAPEVKTAGGENQLKITTNYRYDDATLEATADVDKRLADGLKTASNGSGYEIVSSVVVGPSIANEVVNKSFLVVIVSCILMFLFILFRFRKWQYGLGAVAALVHDVLIVLSCYTIFANIMPFPLEIDQHFIAAILTVMGYSMTDTVVVFDRLREFLSMKGKDVSGEEQKGVINYALNSTLSRTINTSMITFFVLLAIFIFGGETIRGFSFALLIGIVIGTYSSLCIATPIVIDFDRRKATDAK